MDGRRELRGVRGQAHAVLSATRQRDDELSWVAFDRTYDFAYMVKAAIAKDMARVHGAGKGSETSRSCRVPCWAKEKYSLPHLHGHEEPYHLGPAHQVGLVGWLVSCQACSHAHGVAQSGLLINGRSKVSKKIINNGRPKTYQGGTLWPPPRASTSTVV